MDVSKRAILEEFGESLMNEVRDEACGVLQRLMTGKMADKQSKAMYKRIAKLTPEHRGLVEELLVEAVDQGLAMFLNFLDQHEVVVRWADSKGRKHDVRAISDGLMGELYTQDGWIEKFSKFRNTLELEN